MPMSIGENKLNKGLPGMSLFDVLAFVAFLKSVMPANKDLHR